MQLRCYVLYFCLLLLGVYRSIAFAVNTTVSASWTNSTVAGVPELELLLVTGDNPLLPADALFQIQLNSRFTVASDASVDEAVLAESLDSTCSVTVDTEANTLAVQRSGSGSQVSSGSQIRFKLTGITNPSRASRFSVGTMEISDHGATFTQLLELEQIEIEPGNLWNSQLIFTNLLSGRSALLTIHLTPAHSVPHDGALVVYLPYMYGFLSGITLSSIVGLNGKFEISTKYNAIWLKGKAAPGTNSGEMQDIVLTLAGIVHPSLEGSMGPSVLLQTLHADSGVIDQTYVDTSDNVLTKAHVVLSSSILQISEGDLTGAQYTVSLSAPPSGDSDLTLSIGEPSSRAMLNIDPQLVVFTTTNWSSTATITVVAPNDFVVSGTTTKESVAVISHTIMSGDSGSTFAAARDMSVHISENDFPAVRLSDRFLAVVEGIHNDSYRIALLSEPSSDVVIQMIPQDSFVTTLPDQVVFTTSSWNIPKVINVMASSSATTVGVRTGISHQLTSTDSNYDGTNVDVFPQKEVLVYYEPREIESCVEPCRTGWFSLVNAATGKAQCVGCPLGHFCTGSCAMPVPCPKGTSSSVEFAAAADACRACAAGMYAHTEGLATCLVCPEGGFCSDARASPQPCPAGFYSSRSETQCRECPAGTHNDEAFQSACTPCPEGYYCPKSSTNPVACAQGTYSVNSGAMPCEKCPAGFACSDPTLGPVKCPSGSYSLADSLTCTICPSGNFCPSTDQSPQTCSSGYYSTQGSTSCTACPRGFECSGASMSEPVACAFSTYSSVEGAVMCSPCPVGHSCLDATQPPVLCQPGSYSLDGKGPCTHCPKGYKCATTTEAPVQCVDGTYSPVNAVDCLECPAGKYCPQPSSDPISCSAGYYSGIGSTVCIPCPAGMECTSPSSVPVVCPSGAYTLGPASSCLPCPAGSACANATATPTVCDPGTFSAQGQAKCTRCSAGYYCPQTGQDAQLPCLPGTYADAGATACTTCPAGMQCPSTTQATKEACEPGTYSLGGQARCISCPIGHMCPQVDGSQNAVCAPGWFSSGGAVQCTICPAGYACPDPSTFPPVACPDGYYSLTGAKVCIACPAGYACPDPTTKLLVPCAKGTYSTGGASSCTPCPAGFACSFSNSSSVEPCQTGFYSTTGSGSCVECPRGYYCDTPNEMPKNCSVGYYSLRASTSCLACDPGYECPRSDQLPQPCPVGYYSIGAVANCRSCSPGYKCSLASTNPTPKEDACPMGGYCNPPTTFFLCPAGTFGNVTAGEVRAQSIDHACAPCPEGYYCEMGTTPLTRQPCPAGFFCPEGTKRASQNPCPAGTFNPDGGQKSSDVCQICPAGMYCPTGSSQPQSCPEGYYCLKGTRTANQYPCAAGTFSGPQSQLTIGSQCNKCPLGCYCPEASSTPTKCPAGTYNPQTGAAGVHECLACPPGWSCPHVGQSDYVDRCTQGHYCPGRTVLATDHPCPAGTYTESVELIRSQDCTICPLRHACLQGTGGETQTMLDCGAGSFCPNGTEYANQFPCLPGTWSSSTSLSTASECDICPPGKYCEGGKSFIDGSCGPGHYCPLGTYSKTQFPCPSGTYTANTWLFEPSQCDDCPPGYYCPAGSVTPIPCKAGSYTSVNNTKTIGPADAWPACTICPAGYYCIEASVTPKPCGKGKFSTSGSKTCPICEAGYFCNSETTSAANMRSNALGWASPGALYGTCYNGTYCPAGSDSEPALETDACPPAYYCPTATPAPVICPAGTYSNLTGQDSISDCTPTPAGYFSLAGALEPTGVCSPGFYCPLRSTSRTQVPCPVRYYLNRTMGQSEEDCAVCVSGSYCPIGSAYPTTCPAGYYCRTGISSPEACPIGTYANATGLRTVEDCLQCPPGMYCDSTALTTPRGLCDPGYYCTLGAYTSAPMNYESTLFGVTNRHTGDQCPQGAYCPLGSSAPTLCPPGTFNNFTGLESVGQCVPCPPGEYCETPGLLLPTDSCHPGYFCIGGAAVPTQMETPAGSFSLARATAPSPCAPGQYNLYPAQDKCVICPAGSYCGLPGTVSPTVCPTGNYCPEGTSLPAKCLPGTFADVQGLVKIDQCEPCTSGQYCDSYGLSAPSGPCLAGFVCVGGSPVSNPVAQVYGDVCPVASYCPEGSGNAISCPVGSFRAATGGTSLSSCSLCPGGQHCSSTGLIKPSGSCSPSYYCVSGASSPTPTDNVTGAICPAGFFCPEASSAPTKCNAGTFAAGKGQSICDECPMGFYCNGVATNTYADCPAGHYCPAGTGELPVPCPIGTFSNSIRLTNATECQNCTAGYFCGTLGLVQPTGPCAAGSYCPPRAESSFGRTPENATHVCPAGFYCPEGTYLPIPCPIGTYSKDTGLVKTGDCVYCDEGSYCADAGLVKPSGLCKAGYYCKRNNTQPNPSSGVVKVVANTDLTIYFGGQACPTGSYCPQGSASPILCPEGFYTDATASPLCLACPPGYFCPLGCSDYTSIECPKGYYCPESTQRATQFQCPPGSFGNRTGLQDVSQCTPAPGGTYINEYAAVKPTGNCRSGFYCSGGSSTSTPAETTATGGPCLPGTNCPEGSAVPIVCDAGGYCPSTNTDAAFPCSKGFYCVQGSFTGTPTGQNNSFGVIGDVCKRGHYCPKGTSNPIPCLPGTYSDTTQNADASFCLPCSPGFICNMSGIVKPYEKCPAGFICTGGESTATQLCPKGYECPQGSSEPRPCPAGTFADEKGLAKCKLCPERYYCAAGSVAPEPCPPGYLGRTTPLDGAYTSLYSCCEACPPGTFSIEVNRTRCDECLEGYVCLGATNSSHPASREVDKGYPCPPGSYCPAGSSSEIACPAGTYQPNYKAPNESACLPCPANSYQNSVGQASCLPCSTSAFAAAGATKCTCVGSHRAFQMTDGYCICEPGYEFYDQDMILRSDEDGNVDCQPIVYDRCSSSQVRSDSGSCVPATGKACDASCNNGTGTYVASLGVCQCDEQPDLDTVCNQKCRDEKTQIQVNGSTGELQLYNPITREASSLSEDSSTNGLVSKVSCTPGSDCQLHSIAVASTGFSGSYDLPPLISETSRRRLSTASTSTSISNPMVCLSVGNGLLFDLSVAGSYPIYMKDSMLNTNPSFDYGAFRSLASKVNSNSSTVSAFAFSFTEAGTYVFGNSLNAAAQTIVVVMKAGTSCPTEAPIVPLNEKNLITVSAKRRTDDIILAPDWGLIVGLLGGLFGVVIAVIAGLYYFRAKSWTNTAVKSVTGYRAKNKLVNLASMHSKGTVAVTNDTDQGGAVPGALLGTEPTTVEKKQFHLGKQEQVKGAMMEYHPDFERWDEEDLDLRELVDRLQFHHEAVTKSFEYQKEGVKQLMQHLQAEAVELKRLFVNALVASDIMSPDASANNPAASLGSEVSEVPEILPVSEISGRPRSRSVAGREKFLLENLERDLQDRDRFEQKKTAMMDSVSAGLHEIEGWGAQLSELTGAIVQEMSSQVDDRAPERTSSKEESCLEHARFVLDELKTMLGSDPMTQTSLSLIHLAEAEKGRREVGNFVLEASQRYFTAHPTMDGADQGSRDLTSKIHRLLELHDDVEKAQNKEDAALFGPFQSLQKFGAALPQVLAAINDLETSFHHELDAIREEQNPVKEHAVQAQMQSRLSKLMKEVAAGAKRVNERMDKEAPRSVKLRGGAQQAEDALSRALGNAKEQWITADQEQRDRSAAAAAVLLNDPEAVPCTPSPSAEDQAAAKLRDKTLFEIKDLLIELTTLLQRNGGGSIFVPQQLGIAPQSSAFADPRVSAEVKCSEASASQDSFPQLSTAEQERQQDKLSSDLRKTQSSTSMEASSTQLELATRQATTDVVREVERDPVLHRELEDANVLRAQHDEEEQTLESQFREEELAIEQEYLRELSSLEMEFGSGSGDEVDGDVTEPPDNLFDSFYNGMEGDESLPPRLTEIEDTVADTSELLVDDNADIIAQLNDVYSEAWNNRVRILAMEEALRKAQLNERIRRKQNALKGLDTPLSDDNLNALTLEAEECKDAVLEEVVKKQDEMDVLEQEAINMAIDRLRKQVEDCHSQHECDDQNGRDAITELVAVARNAAKEDRAKAEKTIGQAGSELQELLNEYDHDFAVMKEEVETERMRLEAKLKGALAKKRRDRGGPQDVKEDGEFLEQTESDKTDPQQDLETQLEVFTDSSIKKLRDKHFQLQQDIEAQKTKGVVAVAVADAQLAYLDKLSTGQATAKMDERDENSLSMREVPGELLGALAVLIPVQIQQQTQVKIDKLRADYMLSCAERRRELEADAAMRRAKLADKINQLRRAKEQDARDANAQKMSTASESETIDEQERVALVEITEGLRSATEALGVTERKMCEALAQTLASTLQQYGTEIEGQIRQHRQRHEERTRLLKPDDEVGAKTLASAVVNALDTLEDEASQRAESAAQARAVIEREIERIKDDSSESLATLTHSLEAEKRRQEQLLKQRLAQRREQQQNLLPVDSSPDNVAELNAVLAKQEITEKLRLESELEMQTQRVIDEEVGKQRDREDRLKQQLRDATVAEVAAAAMKEAVAQARSEYLQSGSTDGDLETLTRLWTSRQAQQYSAPGRTVRSRRSVLTDDVESALRRLHDEHGREWGALKARLEDEAQQRKDQLAQRLQRKRQVLQNNTTLSPSERKQAEAAVNREEENESLALKASAASMAEAITLAIQRAEDHASDIVTGSLAANSADLDAALEATRRQHEEAQWKLREDLETERRKQEQLLRERLRQRRSARRDGTDPMARAEAEEAEEAEMKQKLEEKLCAQEDEAWTVLREREQKELDVILAPLEAVVSQRLDDAELAERRARQELERLAGEHDRHLAELRDTLEAEKKRQQLALRDKLQRKRDRRGADGVSLSDEEALEMERQAMEALEASFEMDLAAAEAEALETRRGKEIELLAEICGFSASRTAEEAALTLLDGARLEAERVRAEYEAALASRLQRSAAADAISREEMARRLAERKLKRRQQREQQVSQETAGAINPLDSTPQPLDSTLKDREDDGSLDREIANVQAAHARGVRSRQEQLDAEAAARKAALAARLEHKRRVAVKSGESRASEAEMEKALVLEEQQELAAIERDRALKEKELEAEAARERKRLAKAMREADESGATDIERQLAACKQAHDAEAAKLEEALRAERARQELALKQRLAAKRQRRAADGGDTEMEAANDQEAQEAQATLNEQERAARQQLADRQQQELAAMTRKLEQEAEVKRRAAFDLQAAAERELKRLEEEHARERRALQETLLADKQKREAQLREKLAKKKAARRTKGSESQQDDMEEEIAIAALEEEILGEQAVALAQARERQEAAMRLAAAELQEAAAATAKAAAASRQAQDEAARVAAELDRQEVERADADNSIQKLHDEHGREWGALKARLEDEAQQRKDQLAQRLQRKRQVLQNNTTLSPSERKQAEAAVNREEENESLALKASAASMAEAITLAIQRAEDHASDIVTGSLAANSADLDAALEATRRQHEEAQWKLREDLETERRKQEQLLRERLRQRRSARRDGTDPMARAEAEEAEEAEMKQKLEEKLCAQEDEAWTVLREREQKELDVILAPLEAVVSQRLDDAELAERRARQELERLAGEHDRHLAELRDTLEAEKKRQQLALRDKLQRKRDRRGADGVSLSDEEALEMERQAMEALEASFEMDLAAAEAEALETRRGKEIELLAEICGFSASRTAEEAALTLLDGARLEAERVRAEYEAALASRLQRSAAADAISREEMARRLAERKLKRRQQREQQVSQETAGAINPLDSTPQPLDSTLKDREDDGSLDREIANVQAAHARGVRSRQEQLDAEAAARKAALAARLEHKRRVAVKSGESRASEAEMEKALVLEEQQELAAIERDRALKEKELEAEAARERKRLAKAMREADESGATDIERQLAACKQAHDAEAAKLEEALRAERARQELALKQRLAAKRQRRAADGGDTEMEAANDQEAQEAQATLNEQERAARQQLADRQQQELAAMTRKLEQEAEVKRRAAFDLQAAAERELKRLEEEHARERRALQETLLADKQKREAQLREKLAKKKAARRTKGSESQQDDMEEEIAIAALEEEILGEQAVALAQARERQEAAMRLAAAELQEAAAATAKAAAASRQAQDEAARVAAELDRQEVERADADNSIQKLHDEHGREWGALKARLEDEAQQRKDQLAQRLQRKRQVLQNNTTLSPSERKQAEAAVNREEENESLALKASAASMAEAITLAIQRAEDHASDIVTGSLAANSADLDAALEATRRQHEEAQWKLREDLETERRKQEQLLRERLRQRRSARRDGTDPMARAEAEEAEEAEMKQKLEEKLCAQEDEAWTVLREREQKELDVILAPLEAVVSQRLDDAELAERRARQELERLAGEHDRHLAELRDTLEAEKKRQQLALRDKLQRKRDRRGADGVSLSDEEALEMERQAMEALEASFEMDLAAAEAEALETRRGKEIELLAEICGFSASRTAEEAALTLLDGARLEAERVRAEYEAALASRLQRSAAADAISREEMARRLAERKLKRRQQREQQVSQETAGAINPLDSTPQPLDSTLKDREDDGSLDREIANVQAAHARGVRSRQEQLDAEAAARKAALAARLEHKRRVAVKSGESRASEAEMEKALVLEEQQELAAIERDRALKEKELEAEAARERKRLAKAMREADESGATDIERQLAACKQAHDAEAAKLEEALRAERARQELALKQRLAAKRQRRAADGGDTEMEAANDQEAQEAQATLNEQERAARQQLADRQQQELAAMTRKLEQEAEVKRRAAFDLQAAAERELKRLEEEHARERRALQETLLADKQKREAQLREKLAKKKAARRTKGSESQQDDMEEEIAIAALEEEILGEQAVALAQARERQEAAMRLAAAELQEAAAATAKAAAASRQAQDEAARVAAEFDRHRGEAQQLETADAAQSKRKLADRLAEKKRRQQLKQQQAEKGKHVDVDDGASSLQEEAERLLLEAQIEAQLVACREAHDAEAAKLRESLQAERERQERALQERIARRKEKRSLADAQASAKVDAKAAEEAERRQQQEEEAALAAALAAQEQEAWETIQRKQDEDLRVLQEQKHQQERERAERQHQLAQQEMNRLQEEHERELRVLATSLAQEQARQEEKLQQRITQRRARKQRQEEEAAATSAKEQQSNADAEEAARLAAEREREEALADAQAQAEAEAEEKERQEIAARLAQKMEEERARQRREKDELEARLAREAEEQAGKRAEALALQLQQQALEMADKMAREFDTNLRELRETHSADGAAQKARLESRVAAKKARKLRELEEKRELERQRLHARQQQEAEEAARAEQEREAAVAEAARQAAIAVVVEPAPVQLSSEATLTPADDETAPKVQAVRQQQPSEEDDLVAELRGRLELEAEDRRRELEEEKRVELERLANDELSQLAQVEARVAALLAEERAAMIQLLTSRLQALPAEMVKQREVAEREHTTQLQRLTLLLEGRGQQQKTRVRARMMQKRALIEDEFNRKAKLVTAAMNQRFMQEKVGLRLKKQSPTTTAEEAHVHDQEKSLQQDGNQAHSVLSAELVKRLEEMLEDRLLKIEALVTAFQLKAQEAPPAPFPPEQSDPEEPKNNLTEYRLAIAEAVAVGCRYEKRSSMDKQAFLLLDSFGVLDASVVTAKLSQVSVSQLDDRMRARLGFAELLLQSVATKSDPASALAVVEHFRRGNNGDADYASFSPPKHGENEKGTLFLSRAALQELSTGQLTVVILHALAQAHTHTSNLTEPQFISHLFKLLVRCYQGLFTHFQQQRATPTATAELPRKSVIAEAGKTVSIGDKTGSGHWQARLLEMEGFLTRMEARNAPSQSMVRSQSSRLHLLAKQREGNAGAALEQEQVQILQEKLDSAEKLYLQVLRQHEQQTQSVEYWQDLLAEQRDAEYDEDAFDEEDEDRGDKGSKEEDPDAVERQRQREARAQEAQAELERTSQALEGTRRERDELFAQCQQLRDQLNELRGGRTTG